MSSPHLKTYLGRARHAIRRLKNDKAPGTDGISAELVNIGGATLEHEIHHIVTEIPYIEIEFRDAPKKRIKRNLSLNCDENANETRCCRYPLTVDFEKFGWDWIIAPKRYEASYCAGECMISFLPKYEHTHVMQLSTSAIPCCSPKKMSSIKLLYFDMSFNVIYSTIPNMVVEKCSCS